MHLDQAIEVTDVGDGNSGHAEFGYPLHQRLDPYQAVDEGIRYAGEDAQNLSSDGFYPACPDCCIARAQMRTPGIERTPQSSCSSARTGAKVRRCTGVTPRVRRASRCATVG